MRRGDSNPHFIAYSFYKDLIFYDTNLHVDEVINYIHPTHTMIGNMAGRSTPRASQHRGATHR